MIDFFFIRASVLARFQHNPLHTHLERLATHLHEQGFARSSIRDSVLAGDKFGWWLPGQGCDSTEIDEKLLSAVRCWAETLPFRQTVQSRCWAEPFIQDAARPRNFGSTTNSNADSTRRSMARLIRAIHEGSQWCVISTRQRYRPIVRLFITKCCISGDFVGPSLSAQTVTEFVFKQAAARQAHGRKIPSVAVRSFLRFLVLEGEIKAGLEAAALSPPQWALTALPIRLTSEQVECVLSDYEENTASSLRNRAMLLLLARLGLRAGEVIRQSLDDIDWYHGQLNVRPGKTHRVRALPLPRDVGNALIA